MLPKAGKVLHRAIGKREVDSAGLPRRPETNEGGRKPKHPGHCTHTNWKREEPPPGIELLPGAHSTCPQGEKHNKMATHKQYVIQEITK